MTKQDILEYFNDINDAYNNPNKHDDLSKMLDMLTRQEPCADAANKTMAPKDAIKVLNMVEAHGSLTINAKETAIKALQLMDKFLELSVRLPKKGKWEANMRFGMEPRGEMWICSACKEQSMKRSDYCPKCGADMRKEGKTWQD